MALARQSYREVLVARYEGSRRAAAGIAGRRDRARGESRWARVFSPPCFCNARSTLYDSKSKTRGACQEDTRSLLGYLIKIAQNVNIGESFRRQPLGLTWAVRAFYTVQGKPFQEQWRGE